MEEKGKERRENRWCCEDMETSDTEGTGKKTGKREKGRDEEHDDKLDDNAVTERLHFSRPFP